MFCPLFDCYRNWFIRVIGWNSGTKRVESTRIGTGARSNTRVCIGWHWRICWNRDWKTLHYLAIDISTRCAVRESNLLQCNSRITREICRTNRYSRVYSISYTVYPRHIRWRRDFFVHCLFSSVTKCNLTIVPIDTRKPKHFSVKSVKSLISPFRHSSASTKYWQNLKGRE